MRHSNSVRPLALCALILTIALAPAVSLLARGSGEDSGDTNQQDGERGFTVHSGQVPLDIQYLTAEEADAKGYQAATLAGGCFWCMEPPYTDIDGVIEVTVGFSGGHLEHPRYRQVVEGGTGHLEVVQVIYDPELISYDEILEIFWVNIDPLDDGGQFCDRGEMYRSAVFYHDDDQRSAAQESKAALDDRFEAAIVTEIREYKAFYPAEKQHQGYARNNPVRYNFYRTQCGRDARLSELWDD